MSAPIDAGRLRHRLVLEAPVETADGAGGVLRSYQGGTTLWAALVPLSVRESVAADARAAAATHRIILRTGIAVTNRHRFTLGARVFHILAVRDPDESGHFVEVLAEERRE